ncbi:MAG: NADH-quinone oxidoreductase subunit H [Clostridia bacterium]|nr:NADH-quinone oxidoreductase subunit H [Clostridia bacterium]
MEILQTLLQILIFPGLLFQVVIGLLLAGIDRKVVARMQHRVGPPILQPTYDFFKLMGKETIVPAAANKTVYLLAPVVGFVGLVILGLFVPVFGTNVFGTGADLIVILYLLTVPAVCLIVGGSASGSPYAGIGISREMVTMMSYEFPLVMVLLAVSKKVGGSALAFSMADITAWQQANGCGLFHWSLVPAALAMLLVIPAEVGTKPFDVAEAETEICEGPLVEYSGAPLGVFKLNTAVKMFIMTSLFTALFLGGIDTGIVALNAVILVAIDIVITLVSMTTLNAICARLKIEHLFKFYWTIVAALAAASLILVWLGL